MVGQRSNKLRQALSLALLASIGTLSMGPMTHAANIGKTEVQSAQNQPLSASIAVSGIDISDFSASLVGQDIYRQMGLQPNDSMAVSFEATSQTSGRILITTSQPVSAPFADVVLAIRDKGRQQVVPKTLLMPLESSAARVATNRQQINTVKPSLPVVSQAQNQAQMIATPLRVKRSAPPPLLSNTSQDALSAVNLPRQAPAPIAPTGSQSSGQASYQPNPQPSNSVMAAAPRRPTSAPTAPTYEQGNIQLDILKVQITRKVISSAPSSLAASVDPSSIRQDNNAPDIAAAEPKPVATPEANPVIAKPVAPKLADTRYTVQRHDSLWMIADELAQQNNLNVKTVMEQIKALNPNAFINNDINQLKARAQLNLPNYDVVPSEQSLKAAIEARRTQLKAGQKSGSSSNNSADSSVNANTSTNKSNADKSTAKPSAPTRTTVRNSNVSQKLPQARMTVVAPGKDGQAAGTQTQATASTGTGIKTETMATLKDTRQSTAQQAQRVREVNQQLAGYTQKMQLQNQKLAELEERLKELRNR